MRSRSQDRRIIGSMRIALPIFLVLSLVACSGGDAPEPPPAVEAPAAPREPGPPLIQGTVRDDEDRPIEGVRVHGRLHWGGGVKGWHLGIETTTDADGAFALDIEGDLNAQTDAPVSIHLSRDGYVSSESRIDSYRPGIGQWLQIRLLRAGSVAGRVETLEGEPVADALVYVIPTDWTGVDEDDLLPSARTGGDGAYRIPGLPPGTFDVGVRARGRVPALRGPVEVVRGEEAAVKTLRTQPGASVRGRILTPTGKPVRRAKVRAWRNRSFRDHALFGRAAIREAGGAATTADDGTFEIDGLAEAAYTVSARTMGHVSIKASVADVVPPRDGIELVLAPETIVELGIVSGRTGKPVPRFVVAVAALPPRTGMSFIEEVASPAGTFRFAARLGARYRVEVTADGYDVSIREVEPREGEDLLLRIPLVPRE